MPFIRNTINILRQKSTYALLGGFLIHLTLGNKYTLSNVNTYMTSYMRRHGSPRATYGNSIWFSTCYSIGQPTSMVIGGFLERRLSTRLTCLLGCILYSASIALTSQTIDDGFFAALLTYGLLPGLGCGLAYMTPMSNGFGWFPERRGIVAGGMLAGLGLGPFIFNIVQTSYVNPRNLSPAPHTNGYFMNDLILERVPKLFILMGCVYGLLELIGCSLLFEPPASKTTIDVHRNPIDKQAQVVEKVESEVKDFVEIDLESANQQLKEGEIFPDPTKATNGTCDDAIVVGAGNHGELIVGQAIKTREFIILFLVFGLTTQGMLFVNSQLKRYGQMHIEDDNFLAWSGSLGSLANCFGRVAWGLAVDRFSFSSCLAASAFMFCLGSLLTPFEFILASKLLYLSVTIILFVSISGWVCIFPVHISRVFGTKNASLMYGLVYLAQPTISVLISPLIQYLIDHTNRYVPFYTVLVTNAVGLFIYLIFYPGLFNKNKKNAKQQVKSSSRVKNESSRSRTKN